MLLVTGALAASAAFVSERLSGWHARYSRKCPRGVIAAQRPLRQCAPEDGLVGFGDSHCFSPVVDFLPPHQRESGHAAARSARITQIAWTDTFDRSVPMGTVARPG